MKKIVLKCLSVVFLLVLPLLSVSAHAKVNCEQLAEAIQKAVPVELGYSDSTEYYRQYYFSQLRGAEDMRVLVCTESTNFNEFGIFYIAEEATRIQCEKQLKAYISEANARFRNGVVYDIAQYPKFESARVFSAGEYVCYTIMTRADSKKVEQTITQALR